MFPVLGLFFFRWNLGFEIMNNSKYNSDLTQNIVVSEGKQKVKIDLID